MKLTIEYLPNPDGGFILLFTKRMTWFLEAQIEELRWRAANEPRYSAAADGLEKALGNDRDLRADLPNSIRRAVWECREPTSSDREFVRQANALAPSHTVDPGYRAAYDLLRPKLIEGEAGEAPPSLRAALEYECFLAVKGGQDE